MSMAGESSPRRFAEKPTTSLPWTSLAYTEELKSEFYYTIKQTMKKLINERGFKIQFSLKINN
jgi:hypothetical protein